MEREEHKRSSDTFNENIQNYNLKRRMKNE